MFGGSLSIWHLAWSPAALRTAVNVSERTYVRVKDFFSCEHRGKVKTKEGREMDMYFVNGVVPKLVQDNLNVPAARLLPPLQNLLFRRLPPRSPIT